MQSKEERRYREMMNTKLLLLFSAYFVALCLYGVCVCLYQCVLVMKTNATAASAISPYPRSNKDSGWRSAKTDVVGPSATNERTNAGERARTPPLLRSFRPTNERAGGRPRARR
jgi:hypothetical protein